MNITIEEQVDHIIEKIPGYVSRDELLFMARWLSGARLEDGWAVNVGVWKGLSLAVMSAVRQNYHTVGVDHFEGSPELMEVDPEELFLDCLDNLNRVDVHPTLWLKDSVEAAGIFPGKVAFLFLDASHDYESVIADLGSWIPKMISGGVLMVHDYDLPVGHPEDGFTGVSQAVDEICGEWHRMMQDIPAGAEWCSWVGVKP